jgi:hypothetical protein
VSPVASGLVRALLLLLLLLLCAASSGCSLDRSPGGAAARAGAGGVGASSGTGGGAGAAGQPPDAGNLAGSGGLGGQAGGGGLDARVPDGSSADAGSRLDAAVEAGPLGYKPGSIGAPCGVDNECGAGGMSRTCFTENYFAPLLSLPGGYCGKLCDLVGPVPCEPGASCITFPTFPPVLICMRACNRDDDCRIQAGYSCNKPFTSTVSVCSLAN